MRLHADCLTKYHVGGLNLSLAVNARALSLGIKQTVQVVDVVRCLTGRLETAIHDLHVYVIG